MSTMSKSLSVGGVGATPTIEDVVKVALGECSVELDESNLNRIKKESPAPKNFRAEEPVPASPPASWLSALNSKASVFCTLLTLCRGTSNVRPAVLKVIERLLNAQTEFRLPNAQTNAASMAALAQCLHGDSAALQLHEDALHKVFGEGKRLEVSADERVQLCAGQPVATGILSIALVHLKKTMTIMNAVLAQSCEALRANVSAYDASSTESSQQKHLIAAADEVIATLEGSKLINAKEKEGGGGAVPEIVQAPAIHGEALAVIAHAYEALRSELLSTSMPLDKNGCPSLLVTPALPQRASQLAAALLSVASLSITRSTRLAAALPLVTPLNAPASSSSPALPTISLQASARAAALRQQCTQLLQRSTALMSAVSETQLSGHLGSLPSVDIALLVEECGRVLTSCAALEAMLAVLCLRKLEGEATASDAPAADAEPTPETAKKIKKGKEKGGTQFVLGRGTAVLRSYIETEAARALTGAALARDADSLADSVDTLALGALQGEAEVARLEGAVAAALNPFGSGLDAKLDDLKRVIESNAARRKPKIPKGTKDFLPAEMAVRQLAFSRIETVFRRHGAVTIDTPVFELRETLMGKYGEDSKLIYDLADQGGEILSLRYDLTVPFARYVALNGIGNIKRYHIGKVYRRDQPQMKRGRFREFYQCDFDIAGAYAPMVADSEVLKVLNEILTELDIGGFVIKLNHRGLLDAMMAIAGVPAQKFRAICSAIDKLDKEPWAEVRREMVQDKGLPAAVADRIGEFVVLRGAPHDMLPRLLAIPDFAAHPGAAAALADMGTLFELLDAMGALDSISFDLSLARGLDYYTGVIYEAVLMSTKRDEAGREVSVGSIAAGGRYDGLVGMYSGKDVPAVGVSIGIERVFAIMESQLQERAAAANRKIRSNQTQVLVGSIGKGYQKERMAVCSDLWAAGINAEFGYKPDPKMGDILGAALDQGIPFVVVFGEDELAAGTVNVKDMAAQTQDTVARAELVDFLKRQIAERGGHSLF